MGIATPVPASELRARYANAIHTPEDVPLMNAFNDVLEFHFDGRLKVFIPGDIQPTPGDIANAALNELGPLGLVRVREGETKMDAAIRGLTDRLAHLREWRFDWDSCANDYSAKHDGRSHPALARQLEEADAVVAATEALLEELQTAPLPDKGKKKDA